MNSFLQGKKTLSAAPLRAPAASPHSVGFAAAATAQHSPATAGCDSVQPTVEVVKEGDKVVRLVVVCACGERVEIECLYPAGA